jgi:hypothetical protein
MEERAALPRSERGHRDRVARSDMRWLLVWLAVFVAAILTLLAAHQVYRLTGPHPQISALVRTLKHYARWLVPGQKRNRNSQLTPAPELSDRPHYAGSSRASGHEAQRAKA